MCKHAGVCWEFEVQVSSHDELKQGVLARTMFDGAYYSDTIMIQINRDACFSDQDAWYLAWEMANVTTGGMPTRITMISYPIEV